jgi:hypothetical protein
LCRAGYLSAVVVVNMSRRNTVTNGRTQKRPAGIRLTKPQSAWVSIYGETFFKHVTLRDLHRELDLTEESFRARLDAGYDLEAEKRYSAIDSLWAVLCFLYSSLPKCDPVALQRLHADLIIAAERDEALRSGFQPRSGRPADEDTINVLFAKVCIAAAVDALQAKAKKDGKTTSVKEVSKAVCRKIPRRLAVRIQQRPIETITIEKWVHRFRKEAKQHSDEGHFYQHLVDNIKRKASALKNGASPTLEASTYFELAEELIEDLRHPCMGGSTASLSKKSLY